jgi:hypothetical protein
MSIMTLWTEGEPRECDWVLVAERTRPKDGAVVRNWGRSWYEPDTHLEHTENRYELVRDGEVIATENIAVRHRRGPTRMPRSVNSMPTRASLIYSVSVSGAIQRQLTTTI